MKNALNEALKILGIMTIITVIWQALEIITTGDIIPNKIDSIVCSTLTLSLYKNLRSWNASNTQSD